MIKFNQPRYILPLIILPFIYVFFYMYQYTRAESEKNMPFTETSAINPELPNPFLDEDNMKGKFDAFQEAHKYNRDFSAIQEIDSREDETMSKKMAMPNQPTRSINQKPKLASPGYSATQRREYTPSSRQEELSEYEKQMQLFKAQMRYMDSLFQEGEGKKRDEEMGISRKEGWHSAVFDSLKLVGESAKQIKGGYDAGLLDNSKTLNVKKAKGSRSRQFNTILKDKAHTFIKAIIDEELKVTKSSRVRLRLLEDVIIEDQVIPKGQYLFGLISAFKPQRVEIHISSLLANGQILEVAMDIYDLDGMKGLYVPESKFRELAKSMGEDMASGQQLSLDQPPDHQMQLMYGLAKDAFNTTTQTASKAIRQNKARLKYNTQVYLVNSNKTKKPPSR